MFLLPRILCALAIAAASAAPVFADDEPQGGSGDSVPPAAAESAADPRVAYSVAIEGVDNEALLDLLRQGSQLVALADDPPATRAGLARRIDGDLDAFRRILASEGYHAASVARAFDANATPTAVTIRIAPGPQYAIVEFEIAEATNDRAALETLDLGNLGIERGMPARGADIVAAERRVVRQLRGRGHPFARRGEREVSVDHDAATAAVLLVVEAGPAARFGPLTIAGLERIEEDYVRRRVRWPEGERFDEDRLDAIRSDLLGTGLFSAVSAIHAEAPQADGSLPVTLEVAEAPARSIGAGARYSSGEEEFVANVFWEHRNILGRNEDLRIALEGGEITQELEATFLKPDFRRRDQNLLAGLTFRRMASEAFEELSAATNLGLQWPVNRTWRGAMGVSLEVARLEDQESTETSTLAGFPIGYTHDGTDDTLDPTRGARLRLRATPYVGRFDDVTAFLVNRIGASTYAALDEERQFVFAVRGELGSIAGEDTDTIPANKRFYAGGGGSVRGYEFQRIGPFDSEGDPLGGRALVELGAELRIRVFDPIGLVPFIEGGQVYDSLLPSLDEKLQWAAGLGLRYYTAIGPLRADIAFPLNRREGVDNDFEFYLSIGQAF